MPDSEGTTGPTLTPEQDAALEEMRAAQDAIRRGQAIFQDGVRRELEARARCRAAGLEICVGLPGESCGNTVPNARNEGSPALWRVLCPGCRHEWRSRAGGEPSAPAPATGGP